MWTKFYAFLRWFPKGRQRITELPKPAMTSRAPDKKNEADKRANAYNATYTADNLQE